MRFRQILIFAAFAALAAAAFSPIAAARPLQSNACPPGTNDTTYCEIAPGQYCKGVSKKKIPGQKKTPFAQCVSSMAKIRKKQSLAPSQACAGLKKRAKGSKGKKAAAKAFKQCVKGGKQLKLDLANATS